MYAFPTTDRHETPLGKPFAVLVETMTILARLILGSGSVAPARRVGR